MTRICIGTWIEKESRTDTRCPGYYAADYEKYTTEPGEYPAYLDFSAGYTIPMPQWLIVGVPCRVTEGRTYNGFGGLNFSSQAIEPYDSKYIVQAYAYQIGHLVSTGKIRLDPCWEWLNQDSSLVFAHIRESGLTWEKLHDIEKEQSDGKSQNTQ
jgi:hypothetical protein